MNQEAWDSLRSKVEERDQLQARLEQLRTEISELAHTLGDQLVQYHATQTAEPTTTE